MGFNLLFFNARGLTSAKLHRIVSLLDARRFDIIAIAETWFDRPGQNMNLWHHPYLRCHSNECRPAARANNHLPGGCAIFARPDLHRKIHCIALNDAVQWTYQGRRAAVIYLPPSLPPEHLATNIDKCGAVDILVGDVNVEKDVNNSRTNIVAAEVERKDLVWLQPTTQISRWDHLFARPHSVLSYDTVLSTDLPIETDHRYALRAYISEHPNHRQRRPERPKPPLCRRYDFRALSSPDWKTRAKAKRELCAAYAENSGLIGDKLARLKSVADDIVATCRERGNRPKMDALRTLAGHVDEILVQALQSVADQNFTFDRWAPELPTHTNATGDPLRNWTHITNAEAAAKRPKVVPSMQEGSLVGEVSHRFGSLWTPSRIEAKQRHSSYYLPTRSAIMDEISVQTVRRAIIDYDPDTASGTDGLSIVLIKSLRRGAFAHHLTTAFQIFARLSATPLRWNESLTVLLPKDTGQTCPVDRTRPLSMTPMFRRLFEKVTLPALTAHPRMQLHPAQTGFQVGKSTALNIVLLQAELQNNRELRVALLDFADCYDRLSWKYQHDEWKARNIEPHTRNLLVSMTQIDMVTVVSVEGEYTEPIQKGRGVPQGSIWSPFLYNLAADKLVRMVHDHNTTMANRVPRPIGLFADDTSLQALTDDNLERLVAVVHTWCGLADMKIAWQKCVALGTDRDLSGPDENTVIRVEERARYLGVDLQVSLEGRGVDWERYYDRLIKKAHLTFLDLCRLAPKWHPGRRLALVRSFLRSKLEYMAGLFFWIAAADEFELGTPRERRAVPPRPSVRRKNLVGLSDRLRRNEKWGAIWRRLDAEWAKWSAFILSGNKERVKKCDPGIHGLEKLSCRFAELGLLMRRQLNSMNDVPGLTDAIQTLRMKEWGNLNRHETTALPTLLKQERVARLSQSYGQLMRRVLPAARTPAGADKIFFVSSPDLCLSLIRWRQGVWGFGRFTLCVCGAHFTFYHFKKCAAVQLRVSDNRIEPLIEARKIDETAIATRFEAWEAELTAVAGQRRDTSGLTTHTRETPAIRNWRRRVAAEQNRTDGTPPDETNPGFPEMGPPPAADPDSNDDDDNSDDGIDDSDGYVTAADQWPASTAAASDDGYDTAASADL